MSLLIEMMKEEAEITDFLGMLLCVSVGLSVQHTLSHSLNISLERQSRDLGWLPWSSCSGDVIINIFQWLSRAICRDSHLVAIEQN